jgi:hypothetical protein
MPPKTDSTGEYFKYYCMKYEGIGYEFVESRTPVDLQQYRV